MTTTTTGSVEDLVLKNGFCIHGGKSVIYGNVVTIHGSSVFVTKRRLVVRKIKRKADTITRSIEPGVVLVGNRGTGKFSAFASLADAISGQRHTAIRYGTAPHQKSASELDHLDTMSEIATTIHRIALEYSANDRKSFEKVIKEASSIFEGLRLSRNHEKTRARDRSEIVVRLVTRGNPGATAATALGILGNFERRFEEIVNILAPAVGNRERALLNLRSKCISRLTSLLNHLNELHDNVTARMDRWVDGHSLADCRSAAVKAWKLAHECTQDVLPSPFYESSRRISNGLLRTAMHLSSKEFYEGLNCICGVFEEIARLFLLQEVESSRYWMLVYQESTAEALCGEVSRLIAATQELSELYVDTVMAPDALDTMFTALYEASQGNLKNVRKELKLAARALT